LLKPQVSEEATQKALARLDSIRTDIVDGKFPFEAGASLISDDKDTRNNNGLMANITQEGRTSRFKLADLPSEVAKAVDVLNVGEISKPFLMINERGKTVCAIVKLKSRSEGHKATITEDFQVLKNVVVEKRRQERLHEWVVNRIKSTYVRINDRYRDCQFEYEGWIR
jgi:peptidyl-prolyl cis-trans isomerase SurA